MSTIKGSHNLGKLSRNLDKQGRRNCAALLTWELQEREPGRFVFSAQGEVWNPARTDIVMGGQCVGELAAKFPHDKRAQRIRETWEQYHLNDMSPGTREQTAALEKERSGLLQSVRDATGEHAAKSDFFYHDGKPNWHAIAAHFGKRSAYDMDCDILARLGMLDVPITAELRAAALGGLPEGKDTYRYGSRWLYYPLPADVLALIRAEFFVTAEDVTTLADPADVADGAEEPDRDLFTELGLTIVATFIPFSQSRNKANKEPSLNWRVTLMKGERAVLTTLYSAGSAHCPVMKSKVLQRQLRNDGARAVSLVVREECEHGYALKTVRSFGNVYDKSKHIQPNAKDVISSLLLDASVLDSGGFEDWCSNFGFDADSIKDREAYDECIAHALAFKNAVGAAKFEELREAVS